MATGWLTIVGTAIGGFVALAGTLLADLRRERTQRTRDREQDRRKTYVDFATALDAAHAGLREVARTAEPTPECHVAAGRAVHDAGVYQVRERFLMSATIELTKPGETAFLRLVAIRDAVRKGARLSTAEYHAAYHQFAEALWTFRGAVRTELGEQPIAPALLGRTSWSEKEYCPFCANPPGESG